MTDEEFEEEEQAYLRELLADPDVRIFRRPDGALGLELRAMRMPGATNRVPWVWPRLYKTSAESLKPYRLGRALRARTV